MLPLAQPKILLDHSYFTPGGIPIDFKSALRDLGVLLAQNCSFSEHFEALSLLCKRLSGWILRAFITRGFSTFMPV